MTYFHPDRMPVLPARRREAARRQLEKIVERTGRHQRRRPRYAFAGAAVGLVMCVGAASYLIAASQPVTEAVIRCYPMADPWNGSYVTVATPRSAPNVKPGISDARAVCAGFFRRGIIVAGSNVFHYGDNLRPRHVPDLAVCTMPGGLAAVFPGKPGTCARLQLPSAGADGDGSRATHKRARRL